MLNQITIMGRIVRDIDLRTTQNGISVSNFTVAVERPVHKADSEKITDFLDVVAWRGLAEMVAKYFSKGRMICVQGMMTTRKYTDKNGANRISYESLAEHIHFTGEKQDDPDGAQATQSESMDSASDSSQKIQSDFSEISSDDDFPF